MENEVIVSVICLAYNHKEYIVEAIESILMQKTNFKYEILIHDDASTDGTTDIIKKYEEDYPSLIKPIYQEENQYSKGINVWKIIREKAIGKYIAVCEGDDYWIDRYKLDKQVNYMEENPKCSACVHAAYKVNAKNKKKVGVVRPSRVDRFFTVEEVIEGGGGLFATNSVLYLSKYDENKIKFFTDSKVGDYPLMIYLALERNVYYEDSFMSAYRVGVDGSWTNREFLRIESKVKHFDEISEMLDKVDEYSNYQYSDTILRTKKKNEYSIFMEQGNIKKIKADEFKKLYSELSIKNKFRMYIKCYFPGIFRVLKIIKRKISRL